MTDAGQVVVLSLNTVTVNCRTRECTYRARNLEIRRSSRAEQNKELGSIRMVERRHPSTVKMDRVFYKAVVVLAVVLHATLVFVPALADTTIFVAKDGSAEFNSIQAAVNSVANRQSSVVINIKPGVYREKVKIRANQGPITLVGAGAQSTIIQWDDTLSEIGNLAVVATVLVESDGFMAKDLTIENSSPDPGQGANGKQAVALALLGDKAALYRVRLLSFQDTLYDAAGRHYFNNCYIAGSIDFICGNARSMYEYCTLATRSVGVGGAIVAQKRESAMQDTGFLFKRCRIVSFGPTYKGKVMLARAWGAHSYVVFDETSMDDVVYSPAYDDWDKPHQQLTFIETASSGPGARPAVLRPGYVGVSTASSTSTAYSRNFIDAAQWLRSSN